MPGKFAPEASGLGELASLLRERLVGVPAGKKLQCNTEFRLHLPTVDGRNNIRHLLDEPDACLSRQSRVHPTPDFNIDRAGVVEPGAWATCGV